MRICTGSGSRDIRAGIYMDQQIGERLQNNISGLSVLDVHSLLGSGNVSFSSEFS